jgi:type IV pilus biogenesis protein PilP
MYDENKILKIKLFKKACTKVMLITSMSFWTLSLSTSGIADTLKTVAPENKPAAVNKSSAEIHTSTTPTTPTTPFSANVGTAIEIGKIGENMTLLQAQFAELELKLKITQKQKEIDALAAPQAKLNQTSTASVPIKKANPIVASVSGIKGSLEAVLVFPNGFTQRSRLGDIFDDKRVERISATEVVLSDLNGKNPQYLSFNTSPSPVEQAEVYVDKKIPPPMNMR